MTLTSSESSVRWTSPDQPGYVPPPPSSPRATRLDSSSKRAEDGQCSVERIGGAGGSFSSTTFCAFQIPSFRSHRFYYKTPKDASPAGFVVIGKGSEAKPVPVTAGEFGFVVGTEQRMLYMCSDTDEERAAWLSSLQATISELVVASTRTRPGPAKRWTVDPSPFSWAEVFEAPPPSLGCNTVPPYFFAVYKTNRKGLLGDQRMLFELDLDTNSLSYWGVSSPSGTSKQNYRHYPARIIHAMTRLDFDEAPKLKVAFSRSEHAEHIKTFLFRSKEMRERFACAVRLAQARAHAGLEGRSIRATLPAETLKEISPKDLPSTDDGMAEGALDHLEVFCGTWNMGEAPPPDDISSWIHPGADIIVVGVQEAQYEPREGHQTTASDWFATLKKNLPGYEPVVEQSLWIMRMALYVRAPLRHLIFNVEFDTVATGIAGVAGNKGGLGVSLTFEDTSMCFVSCHLAARDERVLIRNENVRDIIGGLRFGRKGIDITNQFHHTFWMGDLNYRIVGASRNDVLGLIGNKKWDRLLRHDQLTQEMLAGRVFQGFIACKPEWKPTYRYNRGDRTYSEEKMRTPSYCDRVLYHCLPTAGRVQTLSFQPHDTIMTSDHSPVSATFRLAVRHFYIPRALESSCQLVSRVEITDLECEGLLPVEGEHLGGGGTANPYVRFEGQFLEECPATPVAKATLNPHWVNEVVPVLRVFMPDRDFVESQCLWLVVRHHDSVKDVSMGEAVLSLSKACADEPVSFYRPLLHRGVRCGFVTGRYHVFWKAASDRGRKANRLQVRTSSSFIGRRGDKERQRLNDLMIKEGIDLEGVASGDGGGVPQTRKDRGQSLPIARVLGEGGLVYEDEDEDEVTTSGFDSDGGDDGVAPVTMQPPSSVSPEPTD